MPLPLIASGSYVMLAAGIRPHMLSSVSFTDAGGRHAHLYWIRSQHATHLFPHVHIALFRVRLPQHGIPPTTSRFVAVTLS